MYTQAKSHTHRPCVGSERRGEGNIQQQVEWASVINSLRRKKHFSIHERKRGSLNEQLRNIFNAVENRSLEQLNKCMQNEPKAINLHGGPFFITPLHFAVEVGWVDGVRDLLAQGSFAGVRNQYSQTPFHYAATGKQEVIMAMLLDNHNNIRAINLPDMRGMSPLHLAAANGCLPVVKLLLENGATATTHDNTGESPLHKAAKAGAFDVMVALMEAGADLREKDLRGITAMRWLILSTTNGLQKLLDHLLITNDSSNRRSPITFNFLPLVTSAGTQQCQLLSYFIDTDNSEILAHPVCHVFLLIKWKTAKLVFLGNLLYFMLYAVLAGLFIFKNQLNRTHIETQSINATSTADDTHSIINSNFEAMRGIQWFLVGMTILLFMNQINRLIIQRCACIKALSFWIQLLSIACVSSLICLYSNHGLVVGNTVEDIIGTVEILLLQLQFLFTLRKYPSHGLYVAMFIRVAKEFLKLFIVYCTLLVSFTAIMFIMFNANDQKDPVHSSWPLLFLKSLTMMVGSVEVTDALAEQLDSHPITGYIIYFFFIILISIVLANLLVALAVSDIRELRASAHLTRLASMVEAILNMEQWCDFSLLRRLGNFCKLDVEAAHVRLWPQQDSRHPSISVEVRKQHQHAKQRLRCCSWLVERLCPRRYQVSIPTTLQDEVWARVTARNTVDVDLDKINVPYKVFFDEILRKLKLLEDSNIH